MKEYIKKPIRISAYQTKKDGEIKTLEGIMEYKKGDYIITGIKGEQYPCRQDIFEETYSEIVPYKFEDKEK